MVFALMIAATTTAGCATTRITRTTWSQPRHGHVEAIHETTRTTRGHPGAGAAAGAILGGILGRAVTGRAAGAVVGAAGGAVVGAAASEQANRRHVTYEVVVRFYDGGRRMFRYHDYPPFRPGQSVTLTRRGLVGGHG